MTRRAMLAGVATAGLSSSMPSGAWAADPALRERAARAGLIYGAAIAEAFDDPPSRALYERECRMVTTDLALKFAGLRPARDVFAFQWADAIVDWARSKGLLVRGHTLIWNESNGDWIDRCSGREVERIFDEHIERVVSRYAGRIHTWDVVNEPFWPDHGEPGGYRRGPWYNAIGPGYIERALRRVRSIDPSVKLCVNEAHCELDNDWGRGIRPCLTRLVGDLRHRGVPLDTVGLQSHLRPALPHDYPAFAAFAARLGESKVDIHLTELDIDDSIFPDAVAPRDRMAAAHMALFLQAALSVPAVTAVINWELADKWSFYERDARQKTPDAQRFPRPLPFDDDLRRKPLYSTLANAFEARAAIRSE